MVLVNVGEGVKLGLSVGVVDCAKAVAVIVIEGFNLGVVEGETVGDGMSLGMGGIVLDTSFPMRKKPMSNSATVKTRNTKVNSQPKMCLGPNPKIINKSIAKSIANIKWVNPTSREAGHNWAAPKENPNPPAARGSKIS